MEPEPEPEPEVDEEEPPEEEEPPPEEEPPEEPEDEDAPPPLPRPISMVEPESLEPELDILFVFEGWCGIGTGSWWMLILMLMKSECSPSRVEKPEKLYPVLSSTKIHGCVNIVDLQCVCTTHCSQYISSKSFSHPF